MEEATDGLCKLYYRHVELGYFKERSKKVYGIENFGRKCSGSSFTLGFAKSVKYDPHCTKGDAQMFDVEINNFRGFRNQEIKFRRLNILIGENNAGKTSMLKFLLLLKQSMSILGNEERLWLEGVLGDFGNFADFTNGHNTRRFINTKITTDAMYKAYYLNWLAPKGLNNENLQKYTQKIDELGGILETPVTVSYSFSKNTQTIFNSKTIFESKAVGKLIVKTENCKDVNFAPFKNVSAKVYFTEINGNNHQFKIMVSKDGFMTLVDPSYVLEYCDKQKDKSLFNKIAYMLISQNYIDHILQSMDYVNPMFYRPKRFYLKNGQGINSISPDFQSVIKQLVNFKPSDKAIQLLKNAVADLGIAQDIFVESKSGSPVVELKVNIDGFINNITDVGCGVSLQIPILMHAILAGLSKSKRILLIEQPEIHLHPALQAKFIEVLWKYCGNSDILIETHSEHIVRKLQVMAKEGRINPKDITIHYFKKNPDQFCISEHVINEKGHISPEFPNGFFDSSYKLAMELLQ